MTERPLTIEEQAEIKQLIEDFKYAEKKLAEITPRAQKYNWIDYWEIGYGIKQAIERLEYALVCLFDEEESKERLEACKAWENRVSLVLEGAVCQEKAKRGVE